jgi:hypothetical protein
MLTEFIIAIDQLRVISSSVVKFSSHGACILCEKAERKRRFAIERPSQSSETLRYIKAT